MVPVIANVSWHYLYVELQQRGFERLTSWSLVSDRVKPLSCEWDNCSGWIYAFMTHERVRYFGIATTVLRSRLDGYSYQLNDVVGSRIMDALKEGLSVEIFGTRRPGIPKPQLEAEESALINEFNTAWNVRR
jgi:hypothetical protein